jgi:hypothetical protein
VNACTSESTCQDGRCEGDVACTGQDPCKTYFCIDDIAGCGCQFIADCRPCATEADCLADDDATCGVLTCECPRGAVSCEQRFCVSTLPRCDDGNACTLNRYDVQLGCVAQPVETVSCVIASAREDAACAAGILKRIEVRLNAAKSLADEAVGGSTKKQKRLFRKARRQLKAAKRLIIKRPGQALSPACRDVLLAAVDAAIAVARVP